MTKNNKNPMKTSSKIIISILCLCVLVLGLGWSYTEGYLTGLFSNSDELEAKKSNYPNYIDRFDFDGINFVQNVALAVPTPETVKTYAHLDGTLTLKHNESKSKVLYVDTPNRVSLSSDDATFYYTSEQLTDAENVTFTRHKFYLLPNVEYDFTYKILNVNEFVDHSGSVTFTLRDKDLSISKEVKTEFMSPLDDYVNISIGDYFENTADLYKSYKIPSNLEISLTGGGSTISSQSPIIYVENYLGIFEFSDRIRIKFLPSSLSVGSVYQVDVMGKNAKLNINGNKLYVNGVPYNLYSDFTSKTIFLGGTETTVSNSVSLLGLYFWSWLDADDQVCQMFGYNTGTNTRSTTSNTILAMSGDSFYSYTGNDDYLSSLTCTRTAYNYDGEIILKSNIMEKPYLLGSDKEIVTTMNITEVKLDIGDTLKTLTLTTENNITSIVIPSEYDLKELEPQDLFLEVDGHNKVIPIYYDPSRTQKDLWAIFENKLAELEG